MPSRCCFEFLFSNCTTGSCQSYRRMNPWPSHREERGRTLLTSSKFLALSRSIKQVPSGGSYVILSVPGPNAIPCVCSR